MIAPLGADPGDARHARFLDRQASGAFHHQMPHAVVAVDRRHARAFLHDADIRTRIHPAGFDAPRVLRQANDAMAVRALQVGFRHQRGHGEGIGGAQAQPLERGSDELAQVLEAYRDSGFGHDIGSVTMEESGCMQIALACVRA